MKIKHLLLTAVAAIAILFNTQDLLAQNSSPYWSTSGNSNAGTTSKLGTTNGVPLKLFTNDKQRMIIQKDGNVGIGTTNSQTKLEVETGDNSWGIIHTNGSTVRAGMYVGSTGGWFATQTNSPLYFATSLLNTNNKAQMALLTNGNLGVGTIVPQTRLEVQTADNSWGIIHANNTTVRVGMYVGSTGGWFATQTNSPLYFATSLLNTNNKAQMALLINGNLGVGTIVPQARLEVQTADNSWGIIHANNVNVRVGMYVGSNGGWVATQTNSPLYFATSLLNTNGTAQMTLLTNGNLGVGTLNPQYKLSVNGTIQAKEVRVETNWADYVFNKDYALRSLDNVAEYIKQNKHLPGIPSAKEIQENGLKVGEVQTQMMEKIEELMLYVIELNEKISILEEEKGINNKSKNFK